MQDNTGRYGATYIGEKPFWKTSDQPGARFTVRAQSPPNPLLVIVKRTYCNFNRPKAAFRQTCCFFRILPSTIDPTLHQDGLKRPKTLEDCPEMAPRSHEIARNGPKKLQDAPKWPHTARDGPKMAP